MEKMLRISSSPHEKAAKTTRNIMADVVIALIPAVIAGTYLYGLRTLWLVAVSVTSCVGFEWLWERLLKKPVTIKDLSAVVTGILLACNVPVSAPAFILVTGAFVAVILAKQIFGGLGQNFINPALAARAFLFSAYSTQMRNFVMPVSGKLMADAVTTATPLEIIKNQTGQLPSLAEVFMGYTGGCLGEVSALAILAGALYLLIRKVITWHIPVSYIGTVFVLTCFCNGFNLYDSFYTLFLGGLMLGAFFMATDYTTSPMTIRGQIVYAVGMGIMTTVIRVYGGYPEGVSYSILFMNLFVPVIDKYMKKRCLGEGAGSV